MALSLESIYKPINDFFLKKFNSNTKNPVIFKLETSGTTINDQDFLIENNPEEEFSDLVNRIPVVIEEEINLNFLSNNIDVTYEQVLSALPFVPEKFDVKERESIKEGFIKILAKAKRNYNENYSRVRGGGIADTYRLSKASPLNWVNKDNNIWETQKFELKEKDLNTNKKTQDIQVLKMRMNDKQLGKVMPIFKMSKTITKKRRKAYLNKFKPIFLSKSIKKNSNKESHSKFLHRDNSAKMTPLKSTSQNLKPLKRGVKSVKYNKTALGMTFSAQYAKLKLNEKIVVKDYIKKHSPSKPILTNGINISFDYCVIKIQREWLSEGMCNINKSWYIPGMKKGALNNPEIGSFTHLPIAFVAVKSLKITANWLDIDKNKLQNVTSFGPFDVKHQTINEKASLTREGIQIIGWMLQKMPVLPPNEREH